MPAVSKIALIILSGAVTFHVTFGFLIVPETFSSALRLFSTLKALNTFTPQCIEDSDIIKAALRPQPMHPPRRTKNSVFGACIALIPPFLSSVLIPVTVIGSTATFPDQRQPEFPSSVTLSSSSSSSSSSSAIIGGYGQTVVEGEASRVFLKARQCESDGDFVEAKKLYEEVISAEPNFIYAWANLGNVLTAQGSLQDALLCYKKAISLRPPRDSLAVIVLNKASIELSSGDTAVALQDLALAERLSGATPTVLTNRAVALSYEGRWTEAGEAFERVISSADRNALPWWLRYSMALLETSRAPEAVAYLQRTLNRFPDESECRAFAAALYTALGSREEARSYWDKLSAADKKLYAETGFVTEKLHWGPKATVSFNEFLKYVKYAATS